MTTGTRRVRAVEVGALLIVGLVGLLRLPAAFGGDQAVFVLSARSWADTGELYTNFWDLKQPGIHVFYRLAGSVFGYNEVGVHLLELVWLLAFGALAMAVLRPRLSWPVLAAAAPLLTVAVYYGIATPFHQTQLEALVGLPLLGAVALSSPDRSSDRSLLLAGLCGGVVLLFKLAFAPILVAVWAVALWARRRDRSALMGAAARLALGAAVPLVVMAVYLAATGTFDDFLDASIRYPLEASSELSPEIRRLGASTRWFVLRTFPLLLLAAVHLVRWVRDRSTGPFTTHLVVWLLAAAAVELVQTFSYWEYHFLVFLPPLGLLAVLGLDDVVRIARDRVGGERNAHRLAWVLVAVAVLPAAVGLLGAGKDLTEHDLVLSVGDRRAYREATWGPYADATVEARFLAEQGGSPDPIYVLGDPVLLLVAGRDQAVPMNGWSADIMSRRQWKELAEDLDRARPPFIYVETGSRTYLADRSEEMVNLLDDATVLDDGPKGTWYRMTPNGG